MPVLRAAACDCRCNMFMDEANYIIPQTNTVVRVSYFQNTA